MKAKKHLGQHFLTSKSAIIKMVAAAEINDNDTVLEIGPGKGILTHALLATGARVVAIETDVDMVEILHTLFVSEIHTKQLILIKGDARTVSIEKYLPHTYKLVANIPYYITGELLRNFLERDMHPSSITVLVQKEVAERIARSKKETILSLSVKVYGTPRYVTTVPARYFNPPPKVDSAILHIAAISKNQFTTIQPDQFFKVIRSAFSSKRKQVINNLSDYGNKENLIQILKSLGLSEKVRAEDIAPPDWLALSILLVAGTTSNRVVH